MLGLRRALLALFVLGVVFAGFLVALVVTSDHEEMRLATAIVAPIVGLAFISTGVFAWWRRPLNRFGLLMTSVGFAYFLAGVTESNNSTVFTIASYVAPLYLVMGNLGLLDTYRGLIGVYVSFGLPLMVWVLFGHFRQIPRELDEAANQAAMDKVRADKLREVGNGHDGTWVAHPALVPVAEAPAFEDLEIRMVVVRDGGEVFAGSVPLSGDLADFGPPGQKAADLAIAEIQAAIEKIAIPVLNASASNQAITPTTMSVNKSDFPSIPASIPKDRR